MANTITQLDTSKTFSQWLSATQSLITVSNRLTEGDAGGEFTANTNLKVDGDLLVTGNINLDFAGFDNLSMNGNLVLSQTDTAAFFADANTTGDTRFSVHNNGSNAYIFDQYPGDNPDLYLRAGMTYVFDLQKLAGAHPFVIKKMTGAFPDSSNVSNTQQYYSVGMTHVELGENNGTIVISKSSSAQAKNKGLLVWKVPANTAGDGERYYYQCTAHASNMAGNVYIENTVTAALTAANSATGDALAFAIALG